MKLLGEKLMLLNWLTTFNLGVTLFLVVTYYRKRLMVTDIITIVGILTKKTAMLRRVRSMLETI